MTEATQLVTGTGLDALDCKMGKCQGVGTTGEGGQRIQGSYSVSGSGVKMLLACSLPFWGSGSGFSRLCFLSLPSAFSTLFIPGSSSWGFFREREREKTTPVFPGMNCRGENRRSCGCWAQLMWMEQQCYRLAPSALSVSHLTRTVALSWSMLPFSEAGVRGPECKGYPTLHISWVGRGVGLEINGRSSRVSLPSLPSLFAG